MSESNIGAAKRLGNPGPCTPMAHNWDDGNRLCNCREASRDDAGGWRVASRLTDAEIAERLGVKR